MTLYNYEHDNYYKLVCWKLRLLGYNILSPNCEQFAIVEQDAVAVRTFPADETSDEGILDLFTSSDGLHVFFSTELAVCPS